MPDTIKPEFGTAMVADADLSKVLRLNKLFDMTCKPMKTKPFVKVTVLGYK